MTKPITLTALCLLSTFGVGDFQARWTITPTYQGNPLKPGVIRLAEDGSSYVGSNASGGLVVRKYSQSGALLWQRLIDKGAQKMFAVAPDGSVYVGATGAIGQCKLTKLNGTTGSVVFEYSASGDNLGGLTVDPQGRAYWIIKEATELFPIETVYRAHVFNSNGIRPVTAPTKLVTGPDQEILRILPSPDGGVFFLSGYQYWLAPDDARSALAFVFPNGTPSAFRYVGSVTEIGAAKTTGELVGVGPVIAGSNQFTITRFESNNRLNGISKFDVGTTSQSRAAISPGGNVFRPFEASNEAPRLICHDGTAEFSIRWNRSYIDELLTQGYSPLKEFQFTRFGAILTRTEIQGQVKLIQIAPQDGGVLEMSDIGVGVLSVALNDSGGVLVSRSGPPSLSLLQLDTLKQLLAASSTYTGGQSFQLTLRSYAGAPFGRNITLSSSNPALQVPPSVLLPSNATEVVIPVTSSTVLTSTSVTVTATTPAISSNDRVELKVTLTPN